MGFLAEWQERSVTPDGRSGQTPFVGCKARSFDSLRSLRILILI